MFRFTVLLLAVLLPHISAWSYDLEDGDCTNLGKPNFKKEIDLKYKFLQVLTEKVEYETQGKIKCVKAKNQKPDGTGGHAEIANGGYAHSFVVVNLESQRGRGMHFIVEVYDIDNSTVQS